MGNRNIQAKINKIKKRRSTLRRTSSGPSANWKNQLYQRNYLTTFDRWFFGFSDNDDVTNQSNNARRAELGLQASWTRSCHQELSRAIQDVPAGCYAALMQTPNKAIYLFWTKQVFFFVRKENEQYIRSINYGDRKSAIQRYEAGKVCWSEIVTTTTIKLRSD